MPRKYIKIKQLYARVPFRECVIQFVVRRQEQDPIHSSQIQFYAKAISYTLDENIELVYSQKHLNSLAIYLIAINSDNRVSNIGFVPLRLNQSCQDCKEKLQGINEQTGFIIYSMQDEPFPQMNHLVNVKMASDRSAHSNESEQSRKDSKLKGINLKRSQFAEEEENMDESHVEAYLAAKNNGNMQERVLMRSKQQGLMPEMVPQSSSHKNIKKQDCSQKHPQIMAKSQLADYIGISDEPQPTSNQKQQIIQSPYSNQHEQLQNFMIQILKHKLKNNKYFQTISHNKQFLTSQRQKFASLLYSQQQHPSISY